jgi:CRISPR/Cas system CSM-associated protein Csm2 small subunit
MDIKNFKQQIDSGGDMSSIFNPSEYVFQQESIVNFYLMQQNKSTTKTQLRKYFNEFKSVHNLIRTNSNLTKQEFDNQLKKVALIFPIIKTKRTLSDNLVNLIESILRSIIKMSNQDFEKAKIYYVRFIEFYETLIAYSRN